MTFGVHLRDGLFDSLRAAAHNDDDVFGIGCADVVEEVVTSAGEGGNLVHHLLNDRGRSVVVRVGGLSVLEVGIAVLCRTFLNRVVGVKSARSEILYIFKVYEFLHILVVDRLYFGNFVAGSETVEEVQERHFGFKRRKVSDEREIHDFLYGVGCEHRETCLTTSHYVGMIAEDVEGVSGKSPRADVEHAGEQFARNLVHIRNHKEQALRRRIRHGKRARAERAVYRARGARLGLHFRKAEFLSEHIGSARRGPFVRNFRHGRGGGYRVDSRDFRKGVGNVAGGGVTVDSQFFHYM